MTFTSQISSKTWLIDVLITFFAPVLFVLSFIASFGSYFTTVLPSFMLIFFGIYTFSFNLYVANTTKHWLYLIFYFLVVASIIGIFVYLHIQRDVLIGYEAITIFLRALGIASIYTIIHFIRGIINYRLKLKEITSSNHQIHQINE